MGICECSCKCEIKKDNNDYIKFLKKNYDYDENKDKTKMKAEFNESESKSISEFDIKKIKQKNYMFDRDSNYEKRNQLHEFKSNNDEDLISVIFSSMDQKIHYSIPCRKTDSFSKIEQMLYKEYPEYKDRALKELRRAKWLDSEVSIYDEIMEVECDDRYVLPFFLGKTDKVDLTKPLEIAQIKRGGSGGLDIDTDFEPKAKEAAKQMLMEKYGSTRVMGIGTYTNVGLASGIKDILRKCDVPYKESKDFCKELSDEMSFEENMENYRQNFPILYETYERNKVYLDFTPRIMNGKRAVGQHAGGCLLLDDDVWNYIPVIHTKEGVATAFVENGGMTELDELGVIKYDFLAITALEVIGNAVESIEEELVKIEEDGIVKIVPRSYLQDKEVEV